MKTNLLTGLALVFLFGAVSAEDWTTTNGTTYRNVTVLRHDNATITIGFDGGGTTLNLVDLPAVIQQKYGLDPKTAAALKAQEAEQAAANVKAQQEAEAIAAKYSADRKKEVAQRYVKLGIYEKDQDRAIADFSEAIEREPNFFGTYNLRGNAKKNIGDLAGAIADYTKSIELEPDAKDNGSAYYGRGLAKKKNGDSDGGIADYAMAIEHDSIEAYKYLCLYESDADTDKGDVNDAIEDLTKIIALKPKLAEAYVQRGDTNLFREDYDAAIADYTKVIEIAPDFSGGGSIAYLMRGSAKYGKADWDGAIADYTKVIDLQPSAFAYKHRGDSKREKGDWEGAIADYTQATKLNDQDEACKARAYAKSGKKDWDGSIDDFTKVIELKPDEAVAYWFRGDAKKNKGDNDGAVADYTKAREIMPDEAVFDRLRGQEKESRNDLDGAMADYDKAIKLKPLDSIAYLCCASVYCQKKHWDAAIGAFTLAISVRSDAAFIYYERGDAKRHKGDLEGAVADYTEARHLAGIDRSPSAKRVVQSPEITSSDVQPKTETTPPPTPPATQGSWHQVTTMSGNTAKNSAPFRISSGRWRVKWSLTSSQAARDLLKHSPGYSADTYAGIYAYAVSEDSPKADDQDIVQKTGDGSDSTELRGAGNWSLKVSSANSDWSLVVEEFR